MTSCNRLCPSVEGSASPLITHRIGVDVCMARQRTFFHKCHRCVYRGQPANWEPSNAAVPVVVLQPTGESVRTGVTEVDLPLPRAAAGSKGKSGRSASKAAGKSKVGKGKSAKSGKPIEADA